MNINEAELIYLAGIFAGIICTFLAGWLLNRGKKKIMENYEATQEAMKVDMDTMKA